MTFTPEWLTLREPADAAARSEALLPPLRAALVNRTRVVVRDVGCGTGSMARWLAPRLPMPQHWVLQDRDPALLAAAARMVTGVPAETHQADLSTLTPSDLSDTDLVTASALLDLLTAEEINTLATACTGRPTLLTLSVAGVVELTPTHPLDAEFQSAFNDHQRRTESSRRLLGPDAIPVATDAFESAGFTVTTAPSPWRLGPTEAALTKEWLQGWVSAAVEQEPSLAEAPAYLTHRLSAPLRAVVHHTDLLALPRTE
ncbi:class I SAM-dependent methyltransferase [Actinokineospora soli]|uniref:Class I SAM-dependent methyltransferase n=1 Tax=Actinokineospora soli TaxID=1048753 RepID=A0ABW2TUK5_9PSEU